MSFYGVTDTAVLDFWWHLKARVGSLICTWQRNMWCTFLEIHLWCDTCYPLDGQHGCQLLFPTCMFQQRWDAGFEWETSCIAVYTLATRPPATGHWWHLSFMSFNSQFIYMITCLCRTKWALVFKLYRKIFLVLIVCAFWVLFKTCSGISTTSSTFLRALVLPGR